MSTNLAMHSSEPMSSTRSKREAFLPLYITCGSTLQDLIVASEMPASRSARPYESDLMGISSQFARSASASNGEAEAWTPLSPTSHGVGRPRETHCAAILPRRLPGGASIGSVGPST